MGTILYNGKFNPQYHETSQPPYQNFSVKVPTDFTSGNAQINVAHATLIGVCIQSRIYNGYVAYSNKSTGRALPLPRGSEPHCCH